MQIHFESRWAVGPEETKRMDTEQLRRTFLIENIFEPDGVRLTLTHYDRYIAGGIMPVKETIGLPNPEALKAAYFLERREMGIINVGGKGTVMADGVSYELGFKEALYLGRGHKAGAIFFCCRRTAGQILYQFGSGAPCLSGSNGFKKGSCGGGVGKRCHSQPSHH